MSQPIKFHRVSALPTTGVMGHVYFVYDESDNTGVIYVYNKDNKWERYTPEVQTYYTGNEEPDDSFGVNGDIYLEI